MMILICHYISNLRLIAEIRPVAPTYNYLFLIRLVLARTYIRKPRQHLSADCCAVPAAAGGGRGGGGCSLEMDIFFIQSARGVQERYIP